MKDDITIDHFNGNDIIRPFPNISKKYDFDFRKIGSNVWRYINSADTIEEFDKQIQSVLEHNGEFRIVEAISNNVIRRG